MSSKEVCFLLLGFFVVVLSFFLLNRNEKMNFYRITVGEEELSYYVMEDTTNIYIEDVISFSFHNDAYLTRKLLEVPLKDLKIKVEAFECQDKNSGNILNCKSFYETSKMPDVKPLENIIFSYKIFHEKETIYEGEYIENLESIIKEKGKYYFVLTSNEENKRSVKKTTILFSLTVR